MKYEEMLKELEESRKGTKTYNQEYISKLNEYVNYTNQIKNVSELLQEADQIRRKYNNDETKEKVEVIDADGRKKTILKEDESEYLKLVEEKKELTKLQQKLYSELVKMQSKKYITSESKKEINSQVSVNEVEEATAKNSNNEIIENTSKPALENQERKNDNMKEKFLSAVEKFESDPIFNPNLEEKASSVLENNTKIIDYPQIEYDFNLTERQSLIDFNNYLERNRIKLDPLVKVRFRNSTKTNLKKAFTCVKKKMSLKKFKKLMPTIFNTDKYVELAAAKIHGKLLNGGIYIRNKGVKFKYNISQKYNSTKTFITNIPKRTEKYIVGKYNNVKRYINAKKEIIEKKKDGKTIKEAMEHVYGENKDKHIDYRIINRAVSFKENTCQRISSVTGKIGKVSKNICNTIAKPFRYLRENVRDNARREELQQEINRIRTENLAKKRVLINNELAKSRSGYVGSIALITVSIIILSIIIFIGIGSLLGR